ncbi:MAG: CpsD/CapB family tyrosine-protein kinase [Chitinivibrionales bacterium]|nr:CpsD/CapB family tyrosine-protein kinase [Chitinivibrionales bacterium]
MDKQKNVHNQNTDTYDSTDYYSAYSEELNQTMNLNSKLITTDIKNSYVKELFRSLRAKILMGLQDSADQSVVITSLEAGAGKSTMSSNIAISCAQQGLQTLLIDGDMRCGVLHKLLYCQKSPGLSNLLVKGEHLSPEAVTAAIQQTTVPNLSLLPCGKTVENSAELLNSAPFRLVKTMVAKKFNLIIFDSPPIGLTVDAVVVHELFSKYIVVVKAGATNIMDLLKKLNEYPRLKSKILGLVLNQASLDKKLAYYKYSKYYK